MFRWVILSYKALKIFLATLYPAVCLLHRKLSFVVSDDVFVIIQTSPWEFLTRRCITLPDERRWGLNIVRGGAYHRVCTCFYGKILVALQTSLVPIIKNFSLLQCISKFFFFCRSLARIDNSNGIVCLPNFHSNHAKLCQRKDI